NKRLTRDLVTLKFDWNGACYEVSSGDFDGAFDLFNEKVGHDYFMKNCHGCAYAEYFPYGYPTFGGMTCFKNNKETCEDLGVRMELLQSGQGVAVQETFVCDTFKARIKNRL
ncbi:MAG: hypothetical protein AB8H12_11580, partial [Lewinella sp.]